MHNISLSQTLNIWDELWKAKLGMNTYAGDTAEIYAYTLMPSSPSYDKGMHPKKGQYTAKMSLIHLLELFCEMHRCYATIDGMEISKWKLIPTFHRCHVTIFEDETNNE